MDQHYRQCLVGDVTDRRQAVGQLLQVREVLGEQRVVRPEERVQVEIEVLNALLEQNLLLVGFAVDVGLQILDGLANVDRLVRRVVLLLGLRHLLELALEQLQRGRTRCPGEKKQALLAGPPQRRQELGHGRVDLLFPQDLFMRLLVQVGLRVVLERVHVAGRADPIPADLCGALQLRLVQFFVRCIGLPDRKLAGLPLLD
mmetsp:Transcript_89874/g.254587  ORF Transcript_89874/g.254587 Transcript_89874/m.254587 type:complete len:201 (+) Transcript_89874:659-1261(+)